ncbi:EexN family lipoprotein [Escherichia coli]|uniref:EexN family lipoprotein n=1 Tax=Escherichia coli TaxID=562 RepID=UPI0019CFBAA3|nr:EexN family lipoprotein [Escherichia coli]MBN6453891.1 EexN family lipoprotein [Escherichia coli]
MKKYLLFALPFFLVGCGEEVKSVDWWRNHPAEASSKVDECKKSGEVSDNCKNAKTALYKNQQQDAPVPQISFGSK